MVLVDTSVWIFALKKKFIPAIKEKIDSLLGENLITTIGIIKLELLGGTKTRDEFTRLRDHLDALYEIRIDQGLWQKAYETAYQLHTRRITVPYTDIIIAAGAICSDSVLLHADKHFDLIAKHTDMGLKVESFISLVQKFLSLK